MSTIITSTLYSPHLKLDWNYDIYLPDQVNSQQKYPLLLMLHGLYGNHTNFLDTNRIDSKSILDNLMRNAKKKIIVAFIDGFNSFYINSLYGFKMETAIIQDLLPYLIQQYRISTKIGIGGISMGGYGASRLVLKYPQIFSAAFLISPAVWNIKHIPQFIHNSIHTFQDEQNNWSENFYNKIYPTTYLSPISNKVNFYIESSKTDDVVPIKDVIYFAQKVSSNQNHVQLTTDSFGAHEWNYWQKAIVPAYTWMIDQLEQKKGVIN